MADVTSVRRAINLFRWMDRNRLERVGEPPARLRDNGPTQPLLLDGDPREEYSRADVETLCYLDFLQPEKGFFELTEKADRLLEVLKARESENGPSRDWVIVSHSGIFIDEGATPPILEL